MAPGAPQDGERKESVKGMVKGMAFVQRRLMFFFVGSWIVVLQLACVTPPSGIRTVEMTEQEDIPVPRSFELKHSFSPAMTFAVEEAKFRSWTGEYTGEGQLGDIVP